MNLTPEQSDNAHRRVQEKYKATLRQRLDEFRTDLHALIRAADNLHRRYVSMRQELDQRDETTIRLPTLKDNGTAETERIPKA